jgi:uncharacterized 2Fe-2S/4Fe-4S cluster protein (DUF4445 family)
MSGMVKIITEGGEHVGEAGGCGTLLEYIRTRTPFSLAAPCGGKGRCGKCGLRVLGEAPEPGPEEKRLIPGEDLARGVRLACVLRPGHGDLAVLLEEKKYRPAAKSALFTGIAPAGDPPAAHKEFFVLPEPSLTDQASDYARLKAAALRPGERVHAPCEALRALPEAIRKDSHRLTLCRFADRILAVEAGDTRSRLYGVAIDIGTTTVAAYLVDMNTKENLAAVSGLNAQEAFGADVISRINYTMTDASGLMILRDKITTQINRMIAALAEKAGVAPEEIYLASIVGNTTMLHLALGIAPRNIASAPFIPVLTETGVFPAGDLGLAIAPGALAVSLPGISAYVGADITAAILACGMDRDDKVNLLIDIGTNGEIVLGSRERLTACSTAAGPAFEGAHISCGTGGVPGAIDSVRAESGGEILYTTVGGEPPCGICGSGIVDLLAFLLKTGLVDETGRMRGPQETQPGEEAFFYRNRLGQAGGEAFFLLVPEEESAAGDPIMLTQKDVREIQLAKAAIAAGIDTLIGRLGIGVSGIARLYLAGGFGSCIRGESAAALGLFPKELAGRVVRAGNAAGKGAAMYLASGQAALRCENIRERTEYVELSSSPQFMDAYIEKMTFS